jgi:sugar-specific transcriptional regulator TrmB/pimeloyl-ACP methyl ester carboxylesterase
LSEKTAKDILTDFGLTKKEAEVYLFLAKYEILTGGEIAKQKKIARSLVYRILKSLQSKGLVETTLETPTRFIAIPLDKVIDLIIKTKQDEALQVQKLKKTLIEDWKKVTKSKPKLNYERFVVIEDSKRIYSKVLQMILATKERFVGLLTASTLARADQFGIFEVLHNRLLNLGISYQLVTNVANEDFEDFKKISSRLVSGIKLNVKTSMTSKEFPRVFIRDDEEILFFIRSESRLSTDEQNEVCVFTNCLSLLQTFQNIFQNMLKDSISANEAIQKYSSGNLPEPKLDTSETVFVTLPNYENKESSLMEYEEVEGFTESSLEEKMQQLNEDEEEILEFASVAGKEFSFKLIEKVANYNRLRLLKKLDAMERKHQLIFSTPTGYRFIQSDVREFFYRKLSPKLKIEYHKLFVEYFEKGGLSEENMEKLGYHLIELGRKKEAILAYLKAGGHAKNNWKIFEAIEHYSKALQMMGNKKRWNKERSEILESLGILYSFADDYEKANECFRKGIKSSIDKSQAEKIRMKIYEKVTIEKEKTKLSYFVYGKGNKTIVFIGASFHFIPQIFHFSKNYQVVYIDLLRMIDPKTSISEYTVNSYLDFLNTIIGNLENSKIYLVGVGLGGALSISYLSKHAHKIAKLVLLATQTENLSSEDEHYKKRIDDFWINAFQNPSWGLKKIKERITPSYFEWEKKAVPRSPDLFRIWNEIPEIASIIMMKLIMEIELEPLLDKINIPTLILHGENDPVSLSSVKKLNAKIPSSDLYIFKGVRLPTIFEAEKFNEKVENFLKNNVTEENQVSM